jgi:hypothetical protein
MSVTITPRDIARRLSAQGRARGDGRLWESFTPPGFDLRGGARPWFDLNSSQGNRLISKYLAARMAKADRRLPSDLDDGAAPAPHPEKNQGDKD